jgi:hypothetical protein
VHDGRSSGNEYNLAKNIENTSEIFIKTVPITSLYDKPKYLVPIAEL